jgi:hypothetical protein
MLYELRVYDVVPGKLAALNDRFETVTTPLFAKHGLKVVGFWTDEIGTSNRLTYMLAFEDAAQRAKAWAGFRVDPERIAKFAETERDGPLVAKVTNTLMAPTKYSPMK